MFRKRCWMLGVLAVLLVPLGVGGADPDNPVVAAARSRQAKVRTLAVEFSETEILAKGGQTTAQGLTGTGTPVLPPQELQLKSQSRLLIAGDKVRYENNHPHWNNLYAADGNPRARISITVRDDLSVTTFYPHGLGGDGEPWALTYDDTSALTARLSRDIDVVALILATVRGFDPSQRVWHLDQFKSTGDTLTIDGTACLECTGPAPNRGHFIGWPVPQNLIYRYWLDAERDYVIRRAQALEQDKVLEQVDVQYRCHDVGGWFPDSWEYRQYSAAGAVLKTLTVTVLSVRFNEEPPADAFTLQFPEGSRVTDIRKSKSTFHVLADGSLREDDPPPGELAPGPPSSDPWYRNKYVQVGAAVALAAAFVGVYWLRRNHQLAARP